MINNIFCVKQGCFPLFSLILITMIGCQTTDTQPKLSTLGSLKTNAAVQPAAKPNINVSKIDESTWRTNMSVAQTFGLLSKIFAQNYVLNQTDKRQLALATEWDKFFINGKLFRNKINANIFYISPRSTEIVLKNSMEYYAPPNGDNGVINDNYWVPCHDLTSEVSRIVQHFSKQAYVLAQNETN